MSFTAAVRFALWPLALTGAAAVFRVALAPIGAPLPARGRASHQATSADPSPYAAESLAAAVRAGDVFRLGHHPAAVPYNPATGGGAQSFVPPPMRPALRLVGLIGGLTPEAAIEGLPGIEGGRLLRVGEQLAGYRVTGIEGGRVRIAGQDTVWVLTLRHP